MAQQATLQGFEAAALRVGVTGAVRTAKVGTMVPTSFTSTYDDTIYTNRGYLSPDGVEISFEEDTNEFIPWQEMLAIRRDITKAVKSVKMTLWQFTKDNAAMYFGVPGGNVVINEEGSWYFDEGGVPEFEHNQLIIDVVDGNKAMKLVLLDAQVTERAGLTFKRDEAIGLELTFTGYPAGSEYAAQGLSGKTARWMFSDSWDATGAKGKTSTTQDGTTPLMVQTVALTQGTKTKPYEVYLSALGGTPPYKWAIESGGPLQAGLELDAAGKIHGTPTAAGSKQLVLKVEDKAKMTATATLPLTIHDNA